MSILKVIYEKEKRMLNVRMTNKPM